MINNKINYIWFILLMDNCHYHQNILLCINKTKQKTKKNRYSLFPFGPSFSFLGDEKSNAFRSLRLTFIGLFYFCVSCHLSCCIHYYFFFVYFIDEQKKQKKSSFLFFHFFVLIINYRIFLSI